MPVILHKYMNELKTTELMIYTILLRRAIASGNRPSQGQVFDENTESSRNSF